MFLQERAFRTQNVLEFDLNTFEPQQSGFASFVQSRREIFTKPDFTGWMVNLMIVIVLTTALAMGFAVAWLNTPGGIGL